MIGSEQALTGVKDIGDVADHSVPIVNVCLDAAHFARHGLAWALYPLMMRKASLLMSTSNRLAQRLRNPETLIAAAPASLMLLADSLFQNLGHVFLGP